METKVLDTPVHVTDATFEEEVLRADLPVIVDFWAPWCAPCRMVAPTLDALAKEYAGKLKVAKVNTDENPQWAIQYGVRGIPTMLFVQGGNLVDYVVGALPRAALEQRVKKVFSL